MRSIVRKLGAAALALSAAGTALAQLEPFTLPAGVACDFPLTFQPLAPGHQQIRITDQQGRTGTAIFAGQFGTLQVINAATGESLTLPGKGAVNITRDNGDGTQTITLAGHWVVVWFPTDNPAGPSTIEYVGQVVIRQAGTVSTLVSLKGKQVLDICAAL